MAFIEWYDHKYSIGVKEIDDQHKRLVSILNDLYASIHAGSAHNEIGKYLISLVNFLKVHFETEEVLMKKINYRYLPEQKKMHQEFVTKVKNYLLKLKRGESVSPMELASFLKEWLMKHIAEEDKKIEAAIQKLQTVNK